MSAEELAQSFSSQNQQQQQQTPQNPLVPQKEEAIIGSKTSEELAAEQAANPKDKLNQDGTQKTLEQLAAEAEIEKNKGGATKTKLDDSFKQGLDKLYQEKKLSLFSDGTDTGYLVPETWEDMVEVLDENKRIWEEGSKAKDKEELLNEILATKSPAWQFLLQNSNTYKDPSELVPLLTAVQNEEYSASLDLKVVEDQEKIIKATLSIQGLPIESIQSEIEDLKERGKLETRALALKPVLDRYNESQTQKILQQQQEKDNKKNVFWNGYYQSLEQNIFKAKNIDGVELKNEHKQLIASALIPDKELGGLPIYTIIDNLVAKGDFKVLSKLALLGIDEKLFDTYFLTQKVDKKVDTVQKVLRQQGTTAQTTDFESEQNKPKPIKKQYGYFG